MKRLHKNIVSLFILLGVVIFLGTISNILAEGPDSPEETPQYFDYSVDRNQDGLPDQLVEAVESLRVQARGRSEGVSTEALDAFAARLPYSAQTREAQVQLAQLGQRLEDEDLDREVYLALEAEMRELEGQMERQDPNYALTLRTLENLAWQKMQEQVQEASDSSARSTNALAQVIDFDDLQRGDIMFSNGNDFATNFLYAMMWAHVATFDGGRNVYEAQLEEPAGVRLATYDSWQEQGTRLAFGRNNQRSQREVTAGLEWAKNRWGTDARTPYNLKFWQPLREDALYCSQLVWRIHRHIDTDLSMGGAQSIYATYFKAKWGLNPTSFVISPDDIALDDQVTLYALGSYDEETSGSYPPRLYFPDIRINDADDISTGFVIRNDSDSHIDVQMLYFDPQSGKPIASYSKQGLAPNAVWDRIGYLPNHGAKKVAGILYASGRVSGVATHETRFNAWPKRFAAYTGVESPTAQVYVPLLLRNVYGINSSLSIQNTGGTTTEVTVAFHRFDNGTDCTKKYTVQPSGVENIDLSNLSCVGNVFVGSARITNSRNNGLAIATTQEEDKAMTAASNLHSGGSTLYAPLVQYGDYEGDTKWNIFGSASVQNVNPYDGSFTTDYYNKKGPQCSGNSQTNNIYRYKMFNIIPMPPKDNGCKNPVVSAVMRANGYGGTIIGWVNQVRSFSKSTYEATRYGSRTISIPLWSNSGTWDTGLSIQNIGDQTARVTVRFYLSDGTEMSDYQYTIDLAGKARTTHGWDEPFDGFFGSAVVTASRPVAVVVNVLDYKYAQGEADGLMSYTP